IVASAVVRIGSKALKNEVMWTIAALAFVAIYFFKVPFPIIIIAALLLGFIGGKVWKKKFLVIGGHGPKSGTAEETVIADEADSQAHTKPSLARGIKICALGRALWWIPVALFGVWLGTKHAVFQEGIFFSKAALVTFGGAYAVLPYVSQQAVDTHQWLSAVQMLDGLGLAETTPGPLIMVLQFVGFLGAWNHPGNLSPLGAATLGAFITTWTTFLPCFLFIFLGAPHIEQLRSKDSLSTAMSAVTAAVVGVILNLAVWFGVHVLFPQPQMMDWFAVVVSAVAFVGMVKWKWGVIPVVLSAGLLGVIYKVLLGF
ncbi:MAG: chromate transporter, partial [Limisphaerales bacterium]